MASAIPKAASDEPCKTEQWSSKKADKLFPQAAALAALVWCFLVAGLFLLTPEQYWEVLPPVEKSATFTGFVTMGITLAAMIFPHIIKQTRLSGIMIAGTVVCTIAMVTNLLMCSLPTVVIVDPVTRARVFLLRWCEWIPLGGLMTFLAEAVNMNEEVGGLKASTISALMQSTSILCGLILPLCPNKIIWWFVFFFSFLPYFYIFPRTMIKRRVYLKGVEGDTLQHYEQREQIKFAYFLILACTTVWSVLVVLYCVNMYIHMNPMVGDRWYHNKGLAMMVDTFFDVLAKAIYMKMITEVHQTVFDEANRVHRQLLELRKLMQVMWHSSSDNIIISARTGTTINAMFSPSFFKLVTGNDIPTSSDVNAKAALMVGINPPNVVCQYVQFNDLVIGDVSSYRVLQTLRNDSLVADEARRLVDVAWSQPIHQDRTSSPLVEHPVRGTNGIVRHCEVKISHHSEDARVGVVRDVSERFMRLEAERKAHREMIARQQDAQAVNRFTRHEVKNGLLEGIELCDSLRSAVEDLLTSVGGARSLDASQHQHTGSPLEQLTQRCINDLDQTIHEILDTVLAEAMARDVIHGDYEPRLERVEVRAVLTNPGLGIGLVDRFPIFSPDGALPYLSLDAQLLRHIHRNAVSNACKYGKAEGKVVTSLRFDKGSGMLSIEVTNEPGKKHHELVEMGESAEMAVFTQGARLHTHSDSEKSHISAGDGAWIMQQCAKTLDGKCQIRFFEDKTVFLFTCKAKALVVQDWIDTAHFEVPKSTWGIAIDDSKVQRRLLGRILGFAGIHESKASVLGAKLTDVEVFEAKVISCLREHPEDKILIIADENLDFTGDNGTQVVVSGSLLVHKLLQGMNAAEESRVLALVRSANDSSEETAIYCSRAHGYFPKGPMQKNRVREVLAPIWADRFLAYD